MIRKFFSFALTASAVAALSASLVFAAAEYAPGQVLVKYKDGSTRTRTGMTAMYSRLGVIDIRRLGNAMKGYEQLFFNTAL